MVAQIVVREDIETIRQRVRLDDVVGEYVALKTAGVGALKGLCPFHDERTASFNVRPQVGLYYCFGCAEGGDVFGFLQKIENLSFLEAVQRLALRIGLQLRYESGGLVREENVSQKQKLYDLHVLAAQFYCENLLTKQAGLAQQFLRERNFSAETVELFGVGYAPQKWNSLLTFLGKQGFSQKELLDSGLVVQGQRGLYDRFRGRVVWPIKDISGMVIGFGARKLFADDQGPKYLNTPETLLYKKSQVLYGLDLAKRSIVKQRQVVVVEGYTDVMACYVSGVETAVATCGTAFGAEHVRLVRRLIMDDGGVGRAVFTFDGDEAGQKAALRVFSGEQKFMSQTYVAVDGSGLDPCDLWQKYGGNGVKNLLSSQVPLVQFVINVTLKRFDVTSVEGRVVALRAVVPVLATIKDVVIQGGYVRQIAGDLRFSEGEVRQEIGVFLRGGKVGGRAKVVVAQDDVKKFVAGGGLQNASFLVERQSLEVLLQVPNLLGREVLENFLEVDFSATPYLVVAQALQKTVRSFLENGEEGFGGWVVRVCENLEDKDSFLVSLVQQLAVVALDVVEESVLEKYAVGVLCKLFEKQILVAKDDLMVQLQSLDYEKDAKLYRQVQENIMVLEAKVRKLRQQ